MDYVWDNPAGKWSERGVTAQGRPGNFAPIPSGHGAEAQSHHRQADFARLAGARPAACRCASRFPPFFDFCPNCGQALPRRREHEAEWFGVPHDPRLPRHVPQGLPVALFGEPGAGMRIPAPPNAEATFISARLGHAVSSLLAFAPRRGVLQYWEPCAEQWLLMEGSPGLTFLRSRAGMLPLRDGTILLPTEAGPARLSVGLHQESYTLDLVSDEPPAAAPGRVAQHVALPVLSGSGIRFLSWPTASESELVHTPQADYETPFSYDGMIWWLHPDGLLRWHPSEIAQWLPWPDGWRPCLSLCKPTPSHDGRLWLCGHDGATYSFLELGTLTPQRVGVDGLRAGWSNFIFRRGHEVRGEPWDEPDVEDLQQHDSLVIPLLRAFSSDRARPSGLVLRLPAHAGRAEDVDLASEAYIEWIGSSNRILDRCTRLPAPLDVQAFLHDGCIWLHHPSWSQMRGWSLP
jgi:hypothetical protein